MSLLFIFERWITHTERVLLCISLSVMLIVASLQVILRNLFDSGIEGGDVVTRHLVLFLLFFGASLSTRDRRHIQMDATAKIIPKKIKPYFNLFVDSFCLFITVLLTMASYKFFLDEKMAGEILFSGIPTWAFILIIPVGFGLISIRYLIHLIVTVLVLSGRPSPYPELQETPHI